MLSETLHPQAVRLSGAQETLLMTLLAKAEDSRSPHSILHDHAAAKILAAIDYDFGKLWNAANALIPVRAREYDEWLRAFLAKHPRAVVLNLGCGLDTRVMRIGPGPEVLWFDVDFRDVIELRSRFFTVSEGYAMVGASLTDGAWLAGIPTDRPAAILAEGVFEYITEEEVRSLLDRLLAHFAHGEIAFDVMNTFAVRAGSKNLKETTGAVHRWAVDDIRTVDALNPRLRRTRDLSLFSSPYIWKLPWKVRVLYGGMSLLPTFRNMMRLLRYAF